MTDQILTSKRFLPLFATQFISALNDNLFKNALMITVTIKLASMSGVLSNLIAALFILPFFLFSAFAGEIADKYDKAKVARLIKMIEFLLAIAAFGASFYNSMTVLLIILALIGVKSAFFGPVKYALLPQHLNANELTLGNAYVQASTYVAILSGVILGTILPFKASVILFFVSSLLGLCFSFYIPPAPSYQKDAHLRKNIFSSIFQTLSLIRHHKVVFLSVLGATWFWIVGTFVLTQIYPLSGNVLNVTGSVITFFLILFSVGVALGSLLCGRVMKGFVHAVYTPLCILLMGICLYALHAMTKGYITPSSPIGLKDFFSLSCGLKISVTIFILAFVAGFYIVPLNTLMQKHAPKANVSAVIGGNNILNSLGMVLISLFSILLLEIGFDISELFLSMALLSVLVFIFSCQLLPTAFWRSILRFVLELFFKVRVSGSFNVQRAGKRTMIIANHTSLLDGLLIAAFMPYEVTFAINTSWSKKWFMKFFSLFVPFFALDPTNPMSMRHLIFKLKNGERVMIFPEGRITTTGGLMKIYEGAGMIASKAGARIVPLRIKGAEVSKFSYLKGKIRTFWFPKIEMTFLKPYRLDVPQNLTRRQQRHLISLKLYDLMTGMLYQTSAVSDPIFSALLKAAKQHGLNHKIAEDIKRKPITYKKLLKGAYVLSEGLKNITKGEDKIGLMLPNSVAELVTFYAVLCMGKTPVMLNFTQGETPFLSCAQTVCLQTVVSSREFIEKGRLQKQESVLLENNIKVIYLEDFAKSLSLKTKISGFVHYLKRDIPQVLAEDAAVILFTSGTDAMPKAVVLSHKNLEANRFQLLSMLSINTSDIFFNALPMFHSFGLTLGGVIAPLSGVKVFLYPSPLHYRIVPELVYDTNATIICGTDTFFFGYGRLGHPYDFFNLKYAIVGGEKLKERTQMLWLKKFGVRIMEGYGATETAPVISLNTPMNYKENTVGRILPGIEYRLTLMEGYENGGLLSVRGDNVMKGYIKADNKGVLTPLKDGWYETGDVVSMDEDGFLSIIGRAKRFAKIGGEMISLALIEETLEKAYPQAVIGVLAVSDEGKGEKLVLITNDENINAESVQKEITSAGLSPLFAPKVVLYEKKPPLLATGKFDYQTALQMVKQSK